jgi:DedD protein
MADSKLLTQDEMALRRRARRRLVGAVAIALTAVVVLPMVFDPEPKPLGPEVDIRIPSRDTPFAAAPAAPVVAAGCAPASTTSRHPGRRNRLRRPPSLSPSPRTRCPPSKRSRGRARRRKISR